MSLLLLIDVGTTIYLGGGGGGGGHIVGLCMCYTHDLWVQKSRIAVGRGAIYCIASVTKYFRESRKYM